ncbi:hypothetical protein B0H10DRAFT_2236718 [Mycena sp. CBHHK59/15]|nr:hypothetical protein B0H10DRAFT_2236718 [Mycena sp. CBHHK59/15]
MIRFIIKQPWQQQPSYHFLLRTTTISYLVAHFPPSALRPPPSALRPPPSALRPPPSALRPPPPPSALRPPPSALRPPPSALRPPPSALRPPPSALRPPPSPDPTHPNLQPTRRTRLPAAPFALPIFTAAEASTPSALDVVANTSTPCNLPSPPLLPRRRSHFAHCHVIQLPAHSSPFHPTPHLLVVPLPYPVRLGQRRSADIGRPCWISPSTHPPLTPLSLVTTAVVSTFRNCKHYLKILLGLLRSMLSVGDSHIVKTINPIVSIFKASRPHAHRLKLQGIHPVTPGSIRPVKLDAKR